MWSGKARSPVYRNMQLSQRPCALKTYYITDSASPIIMTLIHPRYIPATLNVEFQTLWHCRHSFEAWGEWGMWNVTFERACDVRFSNSDTKIDHTFPQTVRFLGSFCNAVGCVCMPSIPQGLPGGAHWTIQLMLFTGGEILQTYWMVSPGQTYRLSSMGCKVTALPTVKNTRS